MSEHVPDDAPVLEDSTVVLSHALRANVSPGQDGKLPGRVKILNWGENKGRTTGARIVVGEKTLKALSVNQERMAHDTVALDYEHQSVIGHPNYVADPRHHAANGVIEVIEGDGVYLSALDYTPNGLEHAAGYKDVSAVAHTDGDGNLILVGSVALTQKGDVSGMTFDEHVAALSAMNALGAGGVKNKEPKDNKIMNEETTDYKTILVELLGLKPDDGKDDVSADQIAAAVAAFGKKPAASDEPDNVTALSAVNERLDQIERDRLVDNATREGKVIPLSAEDIAKMEPDALSAMIEKITPTVPMEKTGKEEKPSNEPVALSADEEQICKQLGLTEEEFRGEKSNA